MRFFLLLSLTAALACDDGTTGADTGMPDGGGDASDAGGGLVTPPAPPAPPEMTPCFAGWREVDEGGVTRCEPWPEGGRAECSGSDAHLPGSPGCSRIGSECPVDGWPAEIRGTPSAVHYVDASAAGGGDGTMGAPYGTITEAMASAASGDVIALKTGDYPEVVSLRSGVTVQGACASGVNLVPADANLRAGVVVVGGGGSGLYDVTVGPAERAGITLDRASSQIDIGSVVIEGVMGAGIRATGGTVTGAFVVVRGTRAMAGTDPGWGLLAEAGGDVTLSDAVFEENRLAGVGSINAGTVVRLTNTVIFDTVPDAGVFGRGIDVEVEGSVELEAVVLEGNSEYGLYVSNAGSTATGSGLVARDTHINGDGLLGIGVAANDGGSVTLGRAFIDDSHESGVVADQNASLTLTDLIVTDTESAGDGLLGRGLHIEEGSEVVVTRAVFARNSDIGLAVLSSSLSATDVTISRTRPRGLDDLFGNGLSLERGAVVDITRMALMDNIGAGLLGFDEGSTLTVTDLLVDGVTSSVADGRFGRGISIQEGVHADLERVRIADVQDLGVMVGAPGTRLVGRDVAIVGVAPRTCAMTTCADEPHGTGVAAVFEATVELDGFEIEDGSLCGALLAGGELDLTNGRVSGWDIGACLQVDDYDQTRLTNEVDYVDNVTNLAATSLPLPDLGMPSEAI